MATVTVTKSKLKNKEKQLEEAVQAEDLDTVLQNIQKIDNVCAHVKCKNRTADFSIDCKYCKRRFCTSHGLPEIHGCGDAVRKDERSKFEHPVEKLNKEDHEKAHTKLSMKLKQMQFERKSKMGGSKKK